MSVPESIGTNYQIAVPLELVPGRDGISVEVSPDAATAAVALPGKPGEVVSVWAKDTGDITFQVGGANVLATAASNPVFGGSQALFLLPATGEVTHISLLALDMAGTVIINCYRRGS